MNTEDEPQEYWMSYSDMMAALLLTFVLIITFTSLRATAMYEKKQEELARQQEAFEQQQNELLDKEQQIVDQQEKLDKIVGVRTDLVNAIKNEFENSDLNVSVDPQTGAISFDSSVLFATDEYELTGQGRQALDEFLPRYFGILTGPDFQPYVAEIIIEGNTDSQGTYMYNLELSQKRALSVAKYCLADNRGTVTGDEMQLLRKIVTANGRSFSNPVIGADGSEDMDASRRVEFKFRLKDDEMVAEMSDILNSGSVDSK